MSDAIAHSRSCVNRPLVTYSQKGSSCVDYYEYRVEGDFERNVQSSSQSQYHFRTYYENAGVSAEQQTVSSRARNSRLSAGPPSQESASKRPLRAPFRGRSEPPTHWLNAVISEAGRIIASDGPLLDFAQFQNLYDPVLAIHVIRERAKGRLTLNGDARAIRQAKNLVVDDLSSQCGAWVGSRLQVLRAMSSKRLWHAAGSRTPKGGFKELGKALGHHFNLKQTDRRRLTVRMISSVDLTDADRRDAKRKADRERAAVKRREASVACRTGADVVKAMMRETGLSRASCYRRLNSMEARKMVFEPIERDRNVVQCGSSISTEIRATFTQCLSLNINTVPLGLQNYAFHFDESF